MVPHAEPFMCSKFTDPDSANSLGILLQCEHHRLVFTNECDVTGDKLPNGALIKKFSRQCGKSMERTWHL